MTSKMLTSHSKFSRSGFLLPEYKFPEMGKLFRHHVVVCQNQVVLIYILTVKTLRDA